MAGPSVGDWLLTCRKWISGVALKADLFGVLPINLKEIQTSRFMVLDKLHGAAEALTTALGKEASFFQGIVNRRNPSAASFSCVSKLAASFIFQTLSLAGTVSMLLEELASDGGGILTVGNLNTSYTDES